MGQQVAKQAGWDDVIEREVESEDYLKRGPVFYRKHFAGREDRKLTHAQWGIIRGSVYVSVTFRRQVRAEIPSPSRRGRPALPDTLIRKLHMG